MNGRVDGWPSPWKLLRRSNRSQLLRSQQGRMCSCRFLCDRRTKTEVPLNYELKRHYGGGGGGTGGTRGEAGGGGGAVPFVESSRSCVQESLCRCRWLHANRVVITQHKGCHKVSQHAELLLWVPAASRNLDPSWCGWRCVEQTILQVFNIGYYDSMGCQCEVIALYILLGLGSF